MTTERRVARGAGNGASERFKYYWCRFGRFVQPQSRIGLLAVMLIFGASLLTLPIPLITRFIIDDILTGRSRLPIEAVGLALVVLLCITAGVGYASQILSARFRESVTADIEAELFGHACSLPYAYHVARQPGYVATRISGDVQSLHGLMAETAAGVLSSTSTFLVGAVAVFLLEPRLAAVCLLGVPVLALVVRQFTHTIRETAEAMQESRANTWGTLHEGLGNLLNLKLLRAEEFLHRRFTESLENRITASLTNIRAYTRYGTTVRIFSGLMNAFVLVYGGRLVMQGEMTLGSLVAFTAYLGFVFNPVRSVADLIGNLQVTFVCMDRIIEIMDEAPEGLGCEDRSPPDCTRGIRVRGLRYSYPNGSCGVDGIDFDIARGERVAFVGPNGSGKTTAAMALVKLYDQDAGTVEIDDRPTDTLHPEALRQSVVVVPQQPILFGGSIRENLLCGLVDPGDAELADVCRMSGVDRIIDSKAEGFQADVGHGGRELSGGERQRIALARALLRKPKVLILDETTSEMDAETEQGLCAALAHIHGDISVLVIAHRPATVVDADRIYVFDAGKVVATGSHEVLATSCDLYRDFCERQLPDNN